MRVLALITLLGCADTLEPPGKEDGDGDGDTSDGSGGGSGGGEGAGDGGGTSPTAPTCTILAPTADGFEAYEGEAVEFVARLVDDSDPEVLVAWTSNVDGVLVAGARTTDHISEVSISDLTRGTHVIKVEAIDSDDETCEATRGVLLSEAPEAPTIEIIHPAAGEEVTRGQSFTVEALLWDAQDTVTDLRMDIWNGVIGDICTNVAPDSTGTAVCTFTPPDSITLQFTVTDTDGNETVAAALIIVSS